MHLTFPTTKQGSQNSYRPYRWITNKNSLCSGTGHATKLDEFSKNSRGGGHFQSKNVHCRFWTLCYNFPKWGGEGGRRPFGCQMSDMLTNRIYNWGTLIHNLLSVVCKFVLVHQGGPPSTVWFIEGSSLANEGAEIRLVLILGRCLVAVAFRRQQIWEPE